MLLTGGILITTRSRVGKFSSLSLEAIDKWSRKKIYNSRE
jgi:hypothetical protein